MQALWDAAFSGPNMVYTTLLIVVLLYWLLVLIGTLDFGSVDVDLDLDADADAEVGGMEGVAGILHFFNLGKVPFMVILSFAALAMWATSILANHYLSNGSVWFPILFFLPIVFVGLITAKLLTTPLIPIFRSLNTEAEAVDYRGQLCTVLLASTYESVGQAEVNIDGTSLLVSIKTEPSSEPLSRGDQAMILRPTEDEKYYLVTKYQP